MLLRLRLSGSSDCDRYRVNSPVSGSYTFTPPPYVPIQIFSSLSSKIFQTLLLLRPGVSPDVALKCLYVFFSGLKIVNPFPQVPIQILPRLSSVTVRM